MVSITRGLFPAVSDLAREVRYRCFDQPLFEQARSKSTRRWKTTCAYLAANPELRTATRECARWSSVRNRWSACSPAGSRPPTPPCAS